MKILTAFLILTTTPFVHADTADVIQRRRDQSVREADGLKYQIPQIQADLDKQREKLRLDPGNYTISNGVIILQDRLDRAKSQLTTTNRIIQRQQIELDQANDFVRRNEAAKDEGSFAENQARVVAFLNSIDKNLAQFYITAEASVHTFADNDQQRTERDAVRKEFNQKIKESLAKGKHGLILKLFKALDYEAREFVAQMPRRRSVNNTVMATRQHLLDFLFTENLESNPQLAKLRTEVIKTVLESVFKLDVLEARDQKANLSNLIDDIFDKKFSRSKQLSKSSDATNLKIAISSTMTVLGYFQFNTNDPVQKNRPTELGILMSDFAATTTRDQALDFVYAMLLMTTYQEGHDMTLEGFEILKRNFPDYRRAEISQILSDMATLDKYAVEEKAGIAYKALLKSINERTKTVGSCQSLF